MSGRRLMATLGVIGVTALGGLAAVVVGQEPEARAQMWLEFGKGFIQLLAIGVFGTVVTLAADAYQESRTLAAQREVFRAGKVARLISAANVINRAWILIEANRSTAIWGQQREEMIDAGFELSTLGQEVTAGLYGADAPFGRNSVEVFDQIEGMARYIEWVSNDFREHKKPLNDMQLRADAEQLSSSERQRLQNGVWEELQSLPSFKDFLSTANLRSRRTIEHPLSPEAARRSRWQRFQAAQKRAIELMTHTALVPKADQDDATSDSYEGVRAKVVANPSSDDAVRTPADSFQAARGKTAPSSNDVTKAAADSYEEVRATTTPSAQRTDQLERIVSAYREQADTVTGPDEVIARFATNAPGQRIFALVAAQERPDPLLLRLVRDAIGESRFAFEQYHALLAAERLWPTPDLHQQDELRAPLTRQLEANVWLRNPSDRRFLAKRILSDHQVASAN